jgi:hypothetical protein
LAFLPAATADAEPGNLIIRCSDIFGEATQGIILFTRGGSPSVFTCAGGVFPDRGDFSGQPKVSCSDIFGPEVHGEIVFTKGGVSVFSCQGGPFS